jgi:hypothetical protein
VLLLSESWLLSIIFHERKWTGDKGSKKKGERLRESRSCIQNDVLVAKFEYPHVILQSSWTERYYQEDDKRPYLINADSLEEM